MLNQEKATKRFINSTVVTWSMSNYSLEQVKEYLGIAYELGSLPSSDKLVGNPWVLKFKEDYRTLYERAQSLPQELRDEHFSESIKTLECVIGWLSPDFSATPRPQHKVEGA